MARSPATPRHRLELALVALIAASVVGLYLVEGNRLLSRLEGYRLDETLAALQTATATTALGNRADVGPGDNPVALLDRPPAGYRGEQPGLEPAEVPPGSWYYDPSRGVLIHRPKDPELLRPVDEPPAEAVPHLQLRLVAPEGRRLQLRPVGPWRRPDRGQES
ncbi:hypothetical protein SAMN05660831_00144 [Thiohalospira halophila DSM 15071]|uniref:Uncharacterized protein n=1 Tax=Thiohalospira halophila DSM 15071 TaxID=1123397 RepID=A0A1I1NIG3_9GAMM|nr:hypothetical protein [Thiohalospira halophila]SFC93530.1 hypothetical protein SAMN05660831_00144 [Thiohalospira halophila DSM 15071]